MTLERSEHHRDVEAVLGDERAVARFWSKCHIVPGTECVWWAGAVSDRGHGRFWLTASTSGGRTGRVIIAHRFAWALAYGAQALQSTPVLGHTGACDNPLCQNVEHLEPTTSQSNTYDWSCRRHRQGGSLNDARGSLQRALAARAAILSGDAVLAALAEGDRHRGQLELFPAR